jgi:Ca2+-binding RTX toxin-like protein
MYNNSDDRGGIQENGLPSKTIVAAAATLATPALLANARWPEGPNSTTIITYGFPQDAPSSNQPGRMESFSPFSEPQILLARQAMLEWESVANVKFVAATPGTEANISFANYDGNAAGSTAAGVTNLPLNGRNTVVWINSDYQGIPQLDQSLEPLHTIVHEMGHALGLAHPFLGGPQSQNSVYFEDTLQYTIMSYIPSSTSGAQHGNAIATSPLLDDIAAIQLIYGENTSNAQGDTTYFSNGIYSIWDTGGRDILDFSHYSQNQRVDLRQGNFSDVGGHVGNVSIAIGSVIEDARGGGGNDVIYGNSASNIFYASPGVDHIKGDANDKVDMRWMGSDFTISAAYDGTGLVQISASGGPVPSDNFTVLDGVEDIITGSSGGWFSLGDLSGLNDHRIRIVGIGSLDGVDVSGAYITPSTMARSGGSIKPAVVYDLGLSKISFSNGFTVSMASVESVVVGDLETTYIGSSEIDSLVTGSGHSIVYGGDGNDSILGAETTASDPNILNGDGGNDSITAHSASFMNGGDGHDGLYGSAMADRISGGSGTNAIFAGAGDDTILGLAGNDNINGGDGIDTYVFSATIDKVRFHFPGDTLQIEDGTSFATLRDVERIIYTNSMGLMGSQFSFDVADVIAVLSSTPGHSMTAPELQAALSQLGQIRSYHDSIAGTQNFVGTPGDDVVEVDESFISIDAGAGNDTLTANSDNHVVTWNMTEKTMSFEGVTVLDVSTFENIVMNARKSVIVGTDGADGIQSGPGGSTVYGGGGDDIIHGAAHAPSNSASFLYGDAGNDTIMMANSDWAFGGDGDDTLISSLDGGHLSGDAGDDVISGGRGSDSILGGDGDDLVYGSVGADTIDGGAGQDVLSFIHSQHGVHVGIGFVSSDMTSNWDAAPHTSYAGVEQIRGSQDADLFDVISGVPDDLRGMGGDDTFRLNYPMASSLVRLYGGDGEDTFDMSTSMGYYSNPVGATVYIETTPPPLPQGQNYYQTLTTTDIEHIIGSHGGDTFMLSEIPTGITIDGNGAPYWSLDTVDFSMATTGISGSFKNITNIAIVRASAYDDTIDVGMNVQMVYGGGGRDVFVARGNDTRFYGGLNDYSSDGEIDTADLTGLVGRATITVQNGGYSGNAITISTTAGRDMFNGIDRIICGNDGVDIALDSAIFTGEVIGGTGNDSFVAASGITFDGGAGYDTVSFEGSSVRMEFAGREMVSGGTGLGVVSNYEEVIGSSMSDIFRAGDGMIFRSGGGADVFHSARGGSTYYGQYGPYNSYQGSMVLDAPGTIQIRIPTAGDQFPGVHDNLGNVAYGLESVTGSTGNDVFTIGAQGQGEMPSRINGGGGQDTLIIVDNTYFSADFQGFYTPGDGSRNGIITGFERFIVDSGRFAGTLDNDTIYGSGTAIIDGLLGNDVIELSGHASAYGGGGNDFIKSSSSGAIEGGEGDDVIYAGTNSSYISGDSGNDIIHAENSSAYINDQNGMDRVYASAQAQVHFTVNSYAGPRDIMDMGDGTYKIETSDGNAMILSGSSQIYTDFYDHHNTIQLFAGMHYHEGIYL